MRNKVIAVITGCVIAVPVLCLGAGWAGLAALRYRIPRNDDLLVYYGDSEWLAPSERIAENLPRERGSLVYDSLNILARRKWPGAKEEARKLLGSSDSYMWLNAALYLAVFDDEVCIPYLIKGLRHRAWRAYPEIAAHLERMTGEHHGQDFDAWVNWWRSTHPKSDFVFQAGSGNTDESDGVSHTS